MVLIKLINLKKNKSISRRIFGEIDKSSASYILRDSD